MFGVTRTIVVNIVFNTLGKTKYYRIIETENAGNKTVICVKKFFNKKSTEKIFYWFKPVDRCLCVENCFERKMKIIIHKRHLEWRKSMGNFAENQSEEYSKCLFMDTK